MTTTIDRPTMATEEFAERVFTSMLGTLDVLAMYLGDKLGLYEALSDGAPTSEGNLAEATGVDGRYVREWLEQQVTTGIVQVDDAGLAPADRKYLLAAPAAEVLTDPDSLAYLAPFARMIVTAAIQMPSLLDAYRTGGGVSWKEFGADMHESQAATNRPWFISELGSAWLPAVPELHEALSRGATVADIGCGHGYTSISMAKAYPTSKVHGIDIDAPSIEAARKAAIDEDITSRVTFSNADAGELTATGSYDVVTAFECIHDLSDPVGVLRNMRTLVADDGFVLVMDEHVGDSFGDRSDEVEQLMYGISLVVCLPDGMSHQPSAGTGTIMRPSTLQSYATEAGFRQVEVLPVENDLWRFYRLHV